MQGRPSSGSSSSAGTPMSIGSRSGSLQPPSSPTSTDTCFMEAEPNPTAVLLEALSKTDKATAPPSPKTQRQLALRPSEPRVPPIVRKAIAYLDQTAVKTEGLFRISGSKARIQEVSYDTSTPGRVSLTLNRKECLGNTRWLAFMSCVHRRVVGYFQFPSQTKSCFHRAERFFFWKVYSLFLPSFRCVSVCASRGSSNEAFMDTCIVLSHPSWDLLIVFTESATLSLSRSIYMCTCMYRVCVCVCVVVRMW